MNEKQVRRTITSIVFIVLCIFIYVVVQDFTGDKSIRTLKMLQTYVVSGHVYDVDGSIGVDDASDIHYEWEDDTVSIQFGKCDMEFTKDQINDPNINKMLYDINLTFDGNVLYYEGVKVPQ
mgnify:CR=1 FL=1